MTIYDLRRQIKKDFRNPNNNLCYRELLIKQNALGTMKEPCYCVNARLIDGGYRCILPKSNCNFIDKINRYLEVFDYSISEYKNIEKIIFGSN